MNRRKKCQQHDLNKAVHEELVYGNDTPTVLIELSQREYKRIKDNCVYVSEPNMIHKQGTTKRHDTINYMNSTLGTNITKNKQTLTQATFDMKDEGKIDVQLFNLPSIKDRMISFVTNKKCIEKISDNVHFITSNATLAKDVKDFQSSGIVLLLTIKHVFMKTPNVDDGNWEWRDGLLERMKKAKPNICSQTTKNNHFSSQGYISSFGNKGSFYKSNDKSTIGQYANKKGHNNARKIVINKEAQKLEVMCADQVCSAVKSFRKFLPNVHKVMAPIVDIAFKNQNKFNIDANLKKCLTSNDGLWHSCICCNAITKEFHVEKDITYTLISVPYQIEDNKCNVKRSSTYFLLKINEDITFAFKMLENTSFFFSVTYLTHRQFSEDGYLQDIDRQRKHKYYNIACYGNERLYRHLRLTFQRCLGLKK